jgi:HEAT repeats
MTYQQKRSTGDAQHRTGSAPLIGRITGKIDRDARIARVRFSGKPTNGRGKALPEREGCSIKRRIVCMPGLVTTFDFLANVENDAAAAVLVAGLDSSQREIRDAALAALLQRRNAAAELNVLRRWADMSLRWKTQIAERPGWLSGAIRTAIVNRDAKLYECGCAAVVFTRDYDSIPVLVAAASDLANPFAAKVAAATLELAELLAEELAGPRDYRVRRDPQLQRSHVLVALERSATSLDAHGRRELLEAFLLLTNRENSVLKKLLQSPADRGFSPLVELLTTSPRPGIERLLLSYLDDPHAPLAAMQILGRRGDVSFVRQLVKKIGVEPTPVVRANLRRIECIPWITANTSILDTLRELEQPGAVHLAVGSAVPRHHALEVVAYLVKHGKVAARRVAAQALADFAGPDANELAMRLTEDDDPLVRAAAARQLRQRNVPGAIQRLLVLLDSQHPVEREAAQGGLVEFTLDRFAANFDDLTPESRRATGALVRRVDSQAAERIRQDLDAPQRGSRKRALEMALALDIVSHLEVAIAALLKDEDQFLRLEAIRALATKDSPLTRQALRDALLDNQPLVQQAAEAALQQLTRSDTVAELRDAARETSRLTAVSSEYLAETPA